MPVPVAMTVLGSGMTVTSTVVVCGAVEADLAKYSSRGAEMPAIGFMAAVMISWVTARW